MRVALFSLQVRAKIAEEKRKAKEGDVTDEETEQERKERWHDIHHDGTGTRANLDAVGRPRHLFHKEVMLIALCLSCV